MKINMTTGDGHHQETAAAIPKKGLGKFSGQLFDSLENRVYARRTNGGLVFYWSRKGVGFGQLTLTVKRGKLTVDAECMGPEFCADVVKQAIAESLADNSDKQRSRIKR